VEAQPELLQRHSLVDELRATAVTSDAVLVLIVLPRRRQKPHARQRRHDQCEDDQDPKDNGDLRRHWS